MVACGTLLRRGGVGSSTATTTMFAAVARSSSSSSWAAQQPWSTITRRGASSALDVGTLTCFRKTSSFSTTSSASFEGHPAPLYTSTHEVLRPESVDPSDGAVTMTVGLTERAFDLIGDVKKIDTLVPEGVAVGAGETIANLHWEGFRRTASDELYHAMWANVSDNRTISLPFAASVVGVNAAAMEDPYKAVTPSDSGWVVRVKASRAAMEAADAGGAIMGEERYRAVCEREEEEEDAAASRSYP